MIRKIFFALLVLILLTACSEEVPPTAPPAASPTQVGAPASSPTAPRPAGTVARSAQPTPVQLSAAFYKFTIDVQIGISGEFIVMKSAGIPPHPSPYFPKTSSLYQAYNGSNTNFKPDANLIREQSFTLMMPLNPRKADQHPPTPSGPTGMALDGVALFNQFSATNQPLTSEINSFDQFNGHADQQGMYHYHLEPVFLTQRFGKNALIGFMLDGFPVYGPQESGKQITNKDLDEFHGHSHATADFPQGTYHYHITTEAPYMVGNGFYGVPGKVTR